jgi:hypothetical protein
MNQTKITKSKIHSAFAGVKRLPDSEMFIAEMDYLWTESFICGNEQWNELPSKAISYECNALTSVTPLGFQFLIPAYMCWVLENTNEPSNTPDHTIYALNAATHSESVFAALTIEQSEAICEFLLWAATQKEHLDYGAAEEALNLYWKRFKKES